MVVILVSITVIFLVSKWLKNGYIFGLFYFWLVMFLVVIFQKLYFWSKKGYTFGRYIFGGLLELYFPRPSNFLSQIFLLACYDYLSNFEL